MYNFLAKQYTNINISGMNLKLTKIKMLTKRGKDANKV